MFKETKNKGFIDPASLITMGVIAITLVGTLLATQAMKHSADNRSQAQVVYPPCKVCNGITCNSTNIPQCDNSKNICNSNSDCVAPTMAGYSCNGECISKSSSCDQDGEGSCPRDKKCCRVVERPDPTATPTPVRCCQGSSAECGSLTNYQACTNTSDPFSCYWQTSTACPMPPTWTPRPTPTETPQPSNTPRPSPTPVPCCLGSSGECGSLTNYEACTNISDPFSCYWNVSSASCPMPPTWTPRPTPTETLKPEELPDCEGEGSGQFCEKAKYTCPVVNSSFSTETFYCCKRDCVPIPSKTPTPACKPLNQSCAGPNNTQSNCCGGLVCAAAPGGYFCLNQTIIPTPTPTPKCREVYKACSNDGQCCSGNCEAAPGGSVCFPAGQSLDSDIQIGGACGTTAYDRRCSGNAMCINNVCQIPTPTPNPTSSRNQNDFCGQICDQKPLEDSCIKQCRACDQADVNVDNEGKVSCASCIESGFCGLNCHNCCSKATTIGLICKPVSTVNAELNIGDFCLPGSTCQNCPNGKYYSTTISNYNPSLNPYSKTDYVCGEKQVKGGVCEVNTDCKSGCCEGKGSDKKCENCEIITQPIGEGDLSEAELMALVGRSCSPLLGTIYEGEVRTDSDLLYCKLTCNAAADYAITSFCYSFAETTVNEPYCEGSKVRIQNVPYPIQDCGYKTENQKTISLCAKGQCMKTLGDSCTQDEKDQIRPTDNGSIYLKCTMGRWQPFADNLQFEFESCPNQAINEIMNKLNASPSLERFLYSEDKLRVICYDLYGLAAGFVSTGGNIAFMLDDGLNVAHEVVTHELGHLYYRSHPELVETIASYCTEDPANPGKYILTNSEGEIIKATSEYGQTNCEEMFCEAVADYYTDPCDTKNNHDFFYNLVDEITGMNDSCSGSMQTCPSYKSPSDCMQGLGCGWDEKLKLCHEKSTEPIITENCDDYLNITTCNVSRCNWYQACHKCVDNSISVAEACNWNEAEHKQYCVQAKDRDTCDDGDCAWNNKCQLCLYKDQRTATDCRVVED